MLNLFHTTFNQVKNNLNPLSAKELQELYNQIFVHYSKSYWNALYRFCFALTKEQCAAEDLLQGAFLKAISGFPHFISKYTNEDVSVHLMNEIFEDKKTQTHFKNWLYKIIKNKFLDDETSKRNLKNLISIEDMNDELPFPDKDIYHQLSENNKVHVLLNQNNFYDFVLDDEWKSKIESLNIKSRAILYLFIEDYTYQEISEILEIPMGTVMSSLSRAVSKLKLSNSQSKL